MLLSRSYTCQALNLLRITTLLLILCWTQNLCNGQKSGSWYRGCFMLKNDSLQNQTEIQGSLPYCSDVCMKKKFYFIGLQGDICHCLSRVDLLEPTTLDKCDLKCNDLEEPNLPCGGIKTNSWSVYAAAGPFLVEVQPQELSPWIEPNIPTTLEAVAVLKEFVDITEEPLIESEWENTVEFVWKSGFTVVGVNISANSSQERAMCTLTFPNTGDFHIDLQVRNLLSRVQASFNVTVVVPKPRFIQLVPLNDPWSLPSCIPPVKLLAKSAQSRHSHKHFPHIWNLKLLELDSVERPVIAVFANTTFVLEVSVATGTHLTFNISIWNGRSWESFKHTPHKGKARCSTPLNCRSVVQRYVFFTTGIFPATVIVSNIYGSVEANLTIVVMDQSVRDVTAYLESPNSSIVPTHGLLVFYLTAVTADRQSTFIRVDFGDGIVKTAAVREKHNITASDSYMPTLFASYGDGCNLSLKFDHVYEEEGVFVPNITLFNNISSVTFLLKQPITTLNKITGIRIKTMEVVLINKPVSISLAYTSMSMNATVVWTIYDEFDALVENISTKALHITFTFPLIGKYKIVCVVFNLINSETATTYITVQESVGTVSLSCNQGQHIEVKEDIVCTAMAESGSNVQFEWNFQDNAKTFVMSSGNLTSVAKHTFFYPGSYNISVTAINGVNSIIRYLPYAVNVEIPVECLNVITSAPSLPGMPVVIEATAIRGTDLKFGIDVGHGITPVRHDISVDRDTTTFSLEWIFQGPARHHITVIVYNHISNISRSVDVHVQDSPPEFSIHVLPTPLANFKTVALKSSTGQFLHRSDLVFRFHFSDGTSRITQAPVVIWEVKQTRQRLDWDSSDDLQYRDYLPNDEELQNDGLFSFLYVNVTVNNRVGHKNKVLKVASEESTVEKNDETRNNKKRRRQRKMPVLWHSTFVRADEFTSFLLANKSRGISALRIDYGDGLKESVSCLSDSCSWGRKFQASGVFELDVSLYGRRPNRKDHALRSVLVVEEPIKGLRLLGPTDVGIGCDQEWIADLESGSHYIFVWSLDGAAEHPTTFNKYVVGFSVPGTHSLHLNVSNDISTLQASLSFTVKYPIVNVSVSVLPTILGIPTNITISVEGGREFAIKCKFGDGQFMIVSSENSALVELIKDTTSSSENSVPLYAVVVEHVYRSIGEYTVSVTVENGISSVLRTTKAVVEEAIGIVILYTNASHLLSIDDNLVVTAVVSSGRNLQFHWDFSDRSAVRSSSEGNTSTAIHQFSIPDQYEVSVVVSNHLQKGVQVTLPFLIEVVEPISKASVTHFVNAAHRHRQHAAALLTQSDGQLSTQELQFDARADGSSVQFTFDFGDGSTAILAGVENEFFQMMVASAKHIYTQEGVYSVKVTVSNALGNLTVSLPELFYVQIPPEGLELKASEECIHFGKKTYFTAKLQKGTNVTFSWKLDDETEYVDIGNHVDHQYRRCGNEIIQVTASNKVDSISSYLAVKIVEKILGVNVSVSDTIVIAGKPVHHKAVVHPPSAQLDLQTLYVWKFRFKESNFNTSYQQYNKDIVNTYVQSGRPLVQVEAGNCLGSVKSAAVELHVVAKLEGVSIMILGSSIVSSPVNLMANFWQGDSLTFTWNFGDGSKNVTTTRSHISHNYSQIGEYTVSLHAANPVSETKVSRRIFVLNQPCDPPEITGLGAAVDPVNQSQLEFLHSEPIRIEAEVRINCTTSSQVKFEWTVIEAESRQSVNLVIHSDRKKHLRCPALLLPSWTLTRGKYAVKLVVEMNGTEVPVYSEAEVVISVLSTPLVSSIHGGIYRHVGQNSLMHLDGRDSRYPDNSNAPIGYNWTCTPLGGQESSCFESVINIPVMNKSQLTFPSSWLSSNYSEFNFTLTVHKLSDQANTADKAITAEETAVSSQVISLLPTNETIDLLLECPQCWRNMINPDRKVSLRTHCPRCPHEPLTYIWEVSLLEDNELHNSNEIPNACVNAGGTFQQMKLGTMPSLTTVPSTTGSLGGKMFDEGVHVLKSHSQPEMITDSGQLAYQESRVNERREGTSGTIFEDKSGSPSTDLLPDPSEDKNQGPRRYRLPKLDLSPEATGSSGNSPSRFKDGVIGEPKEAPAGKRTYPSSGNDNSDMSHVGRTCNADEPDCLELHEPISQRPTHLISELRHPIKLRNEQTLTGFDQASLVIRPGVLQQGRAYFVQVTAIAQDGTKGQAMAYFEVNKSPDKGKCSVQPHSGTSLKTVFRVFCSEWRDEHLPLRYEVSYSLNGTESSDDLQVIYHGLRHKINFQLPSGLASQNYQVLLHIAVLDRLGAKTLICRIPIEVRPTHGHGENAGANVTDGFLYEETVFLHQLALDSIYDGINQDLFGPLTQVASILTAHGTRTDQPEILNVEKRVHSRQNILNTLNIIPLRDEVEVTQALKCLVETTNRPDELNGLTILASRELLQYINAQVKSLFTASILSGWSRGLNFQILHLAVRAVSNLLTALATNHSLFIASRQQNRMYKDITTDVLHVIDSLLQLELQFHSLGEKPLFLQDQFISLNASHFSLCNPSPLTMNGVQFQLPARLENLLSKDHSEEAESINEETDGNSTRVYGYRSNERCFQARALSFNSNPFDFLKREPDMVHSELASLDIYNCYGDDKIRVHGLPNEDMIRIVIPRKTSQVTGNTTSRKYYLNKAAMNVHQLNASILQNNSDINEELVEEKSNRYLHVHIQLEPVLEGLTFPIMVIISSHETPYNLRQHVFKRQYDRDIQEIKIFLSPGSANGDQHYYIGLVEASLNTGRRRHNEIEGRHYTLNTWWGTCVYWNHTLDKWRSNGCKVLPTSTVEALHCRCNHLTTFGGYFELVPNDLSSVNVEDLFSLHENPVVIILVGVSVLLYLILAMILRQADIHDSKKGNCVYLQDNTISHHQKYEVLMETGCNRDAGTTSKISIILHGEEGVSETRELVSDDNYPMFERKSRDRFIVTLPDSLGKIHKIQLWHNNSGSSPGWFLQQVVVRDLNTGQVFYFMCQKWLAVDKDDGKVEREFTALDGRNISFGMIFWCKGLQYINDFHTWLSVWTCPPHSRFTRVQRLTVCFTLLMTYMCLSAMWFKQAPSEIRGEFGLLDLSWHNIIVGCVCCAIVLPLNLLLSFIFRRSLVHYPGYEQDKTLLSGKSGCELVSESEDEPAQPTVTYSILDQSILNWQNIQDWAQKQWLKRQQSVRSSANSVKTSQTSPQLSAPSTTPLVQQTLLAEDDTDQASSGFEDAPIQVTRDRHRIKTAVEVNTSGKKSKNVEHSDVASGSRRIFLPFWCRYVAWVLCFLISCTCGTITILYGFRFGHTKSVMWIQTVYFSFMICIFIAQPFLILACVVHTAICHRKNPAVFDHYDDGFYGEKANLANLHKQRTHYFEEEEELQRGVAQRSRSRYLRFAGPPQEKQLKSTRKKLIKQKRAMLLLSDTVWFISMFVLVCIMAFGKDSTALYQQNKALKRAFAEGRINSSSFMQLKSSTDWYQWSQTVLLDTLYTHTSLNDRADQMSGTLGYVIGQVQLRQLQVKPEPCYSLRFMESDQHCLYSYSSGKRDTTNNEYSWLNSKDRGNIVNLGIMGEAGWYDSSGYIHQLNTSREVAVEQLKLLETQKWISIQTRAVFVEMTLYNAASNSFSSVTLLLERASSGKIFTSSYIMSTHLFRYTSVWDNCILGCELLYIVIAMWMIFHQLCHIVTMRKQYFHHFWNCIELLMSTVSLLYVGFYIYRFVLVSEAVEFMRNTYYEKFINLVFITWWDEMLKALIGVILFCVVIQLLKVLRYHQVFWKLQTVYRRSKTEILMAASLYAGLIMAFSSLNTGLFGAVVYNMRSFYSTVLAVSALSVRAFRWPDSSNTISHQNPWLDTVLFLSFTFCHGFVLTYIFTILVYRLKKTKHCRVLAMTGHQLIALYWDKILKWAGSRPEASYEQTDNTLPPEFTMAEILYLVEELLFRMNALLGISGLPDKRHSFTDSDTTPNGGDDGISSGGSEDQSVPVTTTIAVEGTRLEQCVQKIEDKLCSNEPYLAQLLKLDSIGSNILSEEKEQELRSHLEFEIFRQLQIQRQESADVPDHSYVACPVHEPVVSLNLPAGKISGACSPGLGHLSHEGATSYNAANGKSFLHPSSPKIKGGESQSSSKVGTESNTSGMDTPPDLRAAHEAQATHLKPILLLPPKRSQSMKVPGKQAGRRHLIEVLRPQKQWLDLSTTNEASRETKQIEKCFKPGPCISKYSQISGKKDYQSIYSNYDKKARGEVQVPRRSLLRKDSYPETHSKLRESKVCKQEHSLSFNLAPITQNASLGNISPQSSESEKGHKRTDSSSGQSGHERSNDVPKSSNKRPELPPKPTFSHVILAPIDTGKTLPGWSPKPRQFTYMPELMNPLGAESSSGSEQEATLSNKRVAQGRRNLRKTKSRGKGKGNEESITSSMVLAADFASSGQSGGSDFDIIIHPVPTGIDPDDHTMPEDLG